MPVATITTYHRPPDVASAWALLRDGGGQVRLLAGGTDLVVRCPAEVRELVDLGAAGLDGVEAADDGSLRLGAMATFTQLLEHPDVTGYGTGVLHETLAQIGSVLHRNSATIGGHVARARMSDLIPVLLALDAVVVTYDGHERDVALADHLVAPPRPHVITAVRLPASTSGMAAAFERFSRSSYDHALLNACCRVEVGARGRIELARVALGEPSAVGRRLPAAEAALVGHELTAARVADAVAATRETVSTRGDWLVSEEYRRHLAGVAVERCLRRVAERLPGGTP